MFAKTINVLVIEDNLFDVQLIKDMLAEIKSVKFNVKNAKKLSTGLKALQKEGIDVILLDLNLPDSKGLETFYKVMEEEKNIPVVVFSVIDDETTAMKAVKKGAQDYIIKGQVDSNLLSRSIQYAVERKKAEEKFKQSESKYRNIVENALNYILIVDIEGNILEVNKSFLKGTGYTEDDVIGKHYTLFLHPDDVSRATEIYEKGSRGEFIEFEMRGKNKDGSFGWYSFTTSPIVNAKGSLVGVHYFARDITEKKKTEQALRESEEKFRNLFENSIEAVFTVDIKGNFTSFNRAAEIISGYSRDELIGKNAFDFMKPEFKKEVYQKYNDLFRTGKPIEDLTYVFFDKKGQERTLEGYVNIIRKEDKIIGFQGALRDITEREVAEEKLKESEERYRELVENIEDIVYVLDGKGNAIFFNKAAEKSLGYSKDELSKINYKELITHESYKYAEEIFKRRLYGEDIGVVEHQFKNKKGEIVTIETLERLVWKDNMVVEVHGIGRDITERKKDEEALKESEEKYRNLAEQSLQGLVIAQDVPPRLVYANPAIAEILGLTIEEVLSLSREETVKLIHPDDQAFFFENYKGRLIGKQVPPRYDFRAIRKDGSVRWLELFGSRIEYQGKPAVQAAFMDITERKVAEDGLRESEERYRKLVETSKDGISVVQDGKIVFINGIFTELSEYSEEEILGEPFDKFIYPEDLHIVVDNYRRRISGEEVSQTYEFRLVDKSGRPIPVEVNAVMIDWYGKLAILSFLRDITERKQAEEKIHEVNERMEATLNALPDILFEVDRHGRIYDFRAPHPELLYATSQEFHGRTVNEILPEEASNVIMDAINQAVETGRHTGAIYPLETPVETGLFELSIAAKGDPKTQDGRLICLVRDITERKKAEEALRESEEKWRNLFENSIEAVFTVDLEGNFTLVNSVFEEIWDYKQDEILGENYKKFLKPEVAEEVFKAYNHLFRTRQPIKSMIYNILKKNGEEITVESYINIIRKGEKIVGFQGTLRDISDRKRLEEQLLHTQKMEAIGALAGGMAHNFNNILVGIMGYSEFLLVNKEESDPDYKGLKTIHEGTIRASLLTRELLNIARGGEYKPIKLSLNHVVEKVLPLITGTLDKSIEIETHLAEDLLIIEGDSNQLEQCLLNLCINARDVMPEGGELIIETSNQRLDKDFVSTHLDAREGDYVVLSVTDTGIGMSHELKEHIFEPFYTTKEEKGGTGMGLSTVYGIVKNHGGIITVYSEEGGGSTFKFYFPAMEGIFKETPPIKVDEERVGIATILLVDDEQVVIDMWNDFLLQQGHQVLTAQDGEQALKIFQEKKNEIDLVILDYIMPKMGGGEVLIRLKEIAPDVKILVSSGYSENGQSKEIIAEGADGFIQKPASLDEFHNKIKEILNQKS